MAVSELGIDIASSTHKRRILYLASGLASVGRLQGIQECSVSDLASEPKEIHEHTVMPNMSVTEKDASDIAAFRYTLH
jgi:hypothetical protein